MLENPFLSQIKTLEDLSAISQWATPSLSILVDNMQFDSAHDPAHLLRVVRNALWFAQVGGDPDVIIPAALLHDLVNAPKDNLDSRKHASRLSAEKAIAHLAMILPFKDIEQQDKIFNAIEAHSFSANVLPLSIEAEAVQDADRLDALGLIGIARLFSVGGSLQRALFHPDDPAARSGRPLDEYAYTLDHFYTKLIKLPDTMKTAMGIRIANIKVGVMLKFIDQLLAEVNGEIITCRS